MKYISSILLLTFFCQSIITSSANNEWNNFRLLPPHYRQNYLHSRNPQANLPSYDQHRIQKNSPRTIPAPENKDKVTSSNTATSPKRALSLNQNDSTNEESFQPNTSETSSRNTSENNSFIPGMNPNTNSFFLAQKLLVMNALKQNR